MSPKARKKLSSRVSVKSSLGHAKSAPATLRAIDANRARLRKSGHDVPRAR
jgi:hypothetical protein